MLPPFTLLCLVRVASAIRKWAPLLIKVLRPCVLLLSSMLQWGWRWDGLGGGGGFFFLVITPLPLSYFSLLSVIALAWNVVHGAFTRSISHAEAEHSYRHAATDRQTRWWDDSSVCHVSSVEDGRKTNLSEGAKYRHILARVLLFVSGTICCLLINFSKKQNKHKNVVIKALPSGEGSSQIFYLC